MSDNRSPLTTPLTLAGGMAAGALLAKFVHPWIMGVLGAARTQTTGGDAFDDLTRDHALILGLLDEMLRLDSAAAQLPIFLNVKRVLTKHALAEEDVVYPLLRNRIGAKDDVVRLYAEHAQMKIDLAEIEEILIRGVTATEHITSLREIIREHAHDEETKEFPRLREVLTTERRAALSAKVWREKALVS